MSSGEDLEQSKGSEQLLLYKPIPLGRVAKWEEVAYGVLFLASGESSYLNTTELKIDGGL